MSATDTRYGRRGGGWLPKPPTTPAKDQPPRAEAITDPDILFHPDTIAISRAHDRRTPGSCASDDHQTKPRPPCNCTADPDDLELVWAGRARMAAARRAAGQPLTTTDHQALERSTP